MKRNNGPVTLREGIYWVGAADYNARNFHGYTTDYGTTYNAYLIVDEKIALVDTVKAAFTDDLLRRVAEIIDPAKINYIIVNHVEPDHSGALPALMEICPRAVIVATAQGKAGLAKYYGEYPCQVVSANDTLSLGKRSLQFLPVPMLHWPDSMASYSPTDKLLFSNDAFGQHYASSQRFDTDNDLAEVYKQAAKYYANIVLPFNLPAAKALDAAAKLDIQTIAPSHGVIWTQHIPDILERYRRWSQNKTEERAVVIYDTMYASTEKMAYAAAEGFERASVPVKVVDIKKRHISDIMLDLLEAKYIAVGSPTLNNQIMPTVASFLTYMKGLSPKGRKGFAFGSYGWSGQSIGQIENIFTEMEWEQLTPSVKQIYKPDGRLLASITQAIQDALAECVSGQAQNPQAQEPASPGRVNEPFSSPVSGRGTAGQPPSPQPALSGNPLYNIEYGLYVLSARENGRDNACIVNTFAQITSAEPLVCMVSVNKQNLTHDMVMNTRQFNVSILTTETTFDVIQRFGFHSGRQADKFEGFDTVSHSKNGLAHLTRHANAFLSFEVTETIDMGSHTIFMAAMRENQVLSGAESLTYRYYQQNIKPKPQAPQAGKTKYRCLICGYEYEGENLPPDYICPICKHGAADFVKV